MKNKKHWYKKLIQKVILTALACLTILSIIGYIIDIRQRSSFINKTNSLISEGDISINKSATVICRQEISINAPTSKVWDKLTSIKEWNTWQSAISSTKIDTIPQKGVPFTWVSGGIIFHSTIHTNNEFQSFGWTGTTLGAQAIHNWYFIEEGFKTKVIVEESLEGLLVNILPTLFQENLNSGMEVNLKELKTICEQ